MPPFENLKAFACIAAAVLLTSALLGGSHLLDGPADWESEADNAANLRDALAQAQRERPDLWTPERSARADAAAGMVARGVQP